MYRSDLKCIFLDTAGHGAPLSIPQVTAVKQERENEERKEQVQAIADAAEEIRAVELDGAAQRYVIDSNAEVEESRETIPQKREAKKGGKQDREKQDPQQNVDPRRTALLCKKISEDILKELAVEMSDVIIVVLNELSWSDQVCLYRRLANTMG